MNPVDVFISLAMASGALMGAQRGVLRQILVAAAFYSSLVLAAQEYGVIADLLVAYLPHADHVVASAYTLMGLTAMGTFVLVWLSRQVYLSTALPGVQLFDRLAGAGLGIVWAWAVIGFTLTVALYGLGFSWGAQEPLRREVAGALVRSELFGTARAGWPQLRDSVAAWLPGGMPAPLAG